MKTERFLIWQDIEYSYPLALDFIPHLTSYLHEDCAARPCMLVVPGGGYCVVSPTEAEIVAKKFYQFGCNAFVLTYTTNLLMCEPLKDQPMKDLARAIRFLRSNKERFNISPDRLFLCGFSAGAHLCGSVCVHYGDVEDVKYKGISARPDAAILSYPVITSGEKAHRGSFRALLGDGATDAEMEYYSLEKQVSEDTPPCFLWQTADDESVPVENSALFAAALKAHGVPFAYHVFSGGPHGMSLADDDWVKARFGTPYTMEQNDQVIQAVLSGAIPASEETKQALSAMASGQDFQLPLKEPDPEVSAWPLLAWTWLSKHGFVN